MATSETKFGKLLTLDVSFYEFGRYMCQWKLTEHEMKEDVINEVYISDIYVSMSQQFWYSFLAILQSSPNYRILVLTHCYRHVRKRSMSSTVNINSFIKDGIDHAWNYRLTKLVFEQAALDTVMSYLSTLGGAFSALGDTIPLCAVKAGQISRKQFEVALRLGVEPLVARCRLYLALSLIQQNKLNLAKSIILRQYEVAHELKDTKLKSMCKGIWAKLQYSRKNARLCPG